MTYDTADSPLLANEAWSLEHLARETHTEISEAQQIFLLEYKKLAANAHIKSFLPLLTCHGVRMILDARNLNGPDVSK
jgi:hypothetical protein